MYDKDVTRLLTSHEAEKACSKIWLIYTRLKELDWKLWERPGVLYVGGGTDRTAWEILCELAGVASGTLNKAIKWMAEKKVIAYFARKNGVGIRIYFNVAINSIKPKEKNLRLVPTSSGEAPASANEAPSCDSKAITKNIQDSDKRTVARDDEPLGVPPSPLPPPPPVTLPPSSPLRLRLVPPSPDFDELTARLAALEAGSVQVQKALREVVARVPDKDWLEKFGLPKMTRVLFKEFYKAQGQGRPKADVGASSAPDLEIYLAAQAAEQQAATQVAQALAALPPALYQQWYAELEQQCQRDPRYKTWEQWLPDVQRDHLEGLMRERL